MKKIGLSILALILIAGIIYAGYFFLEEKRVKDYSTACMDKVREEIGNEYLGNIALIDSEKVDGVYHYFGTCSDETSDYYFSCTVTNKDNVDVKIEVDEVPDDFDGCNNYFDGCNRCSMQDDGEIVCTELACEEYQEAYCADEPVVDEPEISLIDQLKQSFTGNLINGKVDESLLTNKPNNIYFDITGDSTLYYIDEFGLAFTLGEEWKGGKIENAYEGKYLASVRIRNEGLKTYGIFIIDNTTYQRIKDSLSNDEDETIGYNNQYTFQRRIVDNGDKLGEYNLVLYEVDVEESEVNLEAIDTEEERKERCKDDAMKQFNEIIPDGEFVNLVWEGLEKETRDESGRLTIIHGNFRIVYNKDGYEWFWPGLCETNFVEGNQKVIFNQSYMNI